MVVFHSVCPKFEDNSLNDDDFYERNSYDEDYYYRRESWDAVRAIPLHTHVLLLQRKTKK